MNAALEELRNRHRQCTCGTCSAGEVTVVCYECEQLWPCQTKQHIDSHDALLAAAEAARDEFAFVLGRTKRRKSPVKTVTEILDELEAAIEGAKS